MHSARPARPAGKPRSAQHLDRSKAQSPNDTVVVSLPLPPIRAPKERWQHGACALVSAEDGVEAECAVDGLPLEALLHRQLISPEAYREGCALRGLWTASGMARRLVQRYDDAYGGGERDMTDAEDRAYSDLHRRLRVAGKRCAPVLMDVCCLQVAIGPLPLLQQGLAALVAHLTMGEGRVLK